MLWGILKMLKDATQELAAIGCEVSLFIDADFAQIDAAVACGAPTIEIAHGCLCGCRNTQKHNKQN